MRRLAAAAVACACLAGCSSIPTSSSIRYGEEPRDSAGQQTRVIARPPVDGMVPSAIARGFLEACADPSNNFSVARQFLLGATAAKWDPNAGVRVYDPTGLTLAETTSEITLSGRLESVISAEGVRTVVTGLPSLTEKLQIAKDEFGQWRIADVPDGVLLSRSEVERSHRQLAVYFLTPKLTALVADPLVVPSTASALATTLVQRLLAGPSIQLGDAARTAFPAGTRLTYGSVPVKDGVAYVDLSADVLAAEQPARRALAAQLVWTLSQLPSVASVRVSVSGQLLAIPGIGVVTNTRDWKAFSPVLPSNRLYVAKGAAIQLITDMASQTVTRSTAPLGRTLATVAVDARTSRLAATTVGGGEVLANLDAKARLRRVIQGEALSRPTWDVNGNLYAADYGRGIRAVTPAGISLAVVLDRNDIGAEMQVKQLAFASDGVRVALVFAVGSRDRLAFGSLHVEDGVSRIKELHLAETAITSVRDVAWAGPLTVAVLGAQGASGQQVFTVGVADGKSVAVATPVGAQSVAVNAAGDIYVGVVDGSRTTIERRQYGQWAQLTAGAGPSFGP